MRRSPLRRYTALKTTTALKRSRPKRKSGKTLDRDLRERVMIRDRGCLGARMIRDVDCWGEWHCHHIRRRSQGGTDHEDNLVTLCAAHHGWVHANPERAASLGLLRLRQA